MRLRFLPLGWLFAACLVMIALGAVRTAAAQTFIDEVRVRMIEPASGKVRPLEEAILKVEIYGTIRSKDGSEQKGLLPLDAAYMSFATENSGWISKAYQCPDFNQRDYIRERTGGWRDILGTVQNFTLKSCFLYTAPARAGRYRLQASKDGMFGETSIEVSASAPPRGSRNFTPSLTSRAERPLLPLVEHYAPFIAQETWFNVTADSLARFDYDGDFHGDNNWENLGTGSSQAYVYYAVMETGTHWFLHYNFFHPRDYSDVCVVGTCHENDNEGLILAVRKDGTKFGKLEVMESLAHNLLFSYVADDRIGERAQNLDGTLALYEGSHPMIFIEAAAMEWRARRMASSRFMTTWSGAGCPAPRVSPMSTRGSGTPVHAGAETVGYALLPIYEHWWLRAIDDSGRTERMFADYYTYAPLGDRPLTPVNMIPGAFLGQAKSANKARPFWGWFDDRTLKQGILAKGQWALDPAYSFTRNLRFPDELPVSLDYTFNPYLGIGTVAGARKAGSNPVKGDAPVTSTTTPETTQGWGTPPSSPSPSNEQTPPSLDGWGQPANNPAPQAPAGWGDPPASQQPQQQPEGWGTPEQPKQKAPQGW